MQNRQTGVTFWGFVWSAVLFVCVCYLLILSIPPYLNNQKIHHALTSLAEEPEVMTMSRGALLRLMKRKLNIDHANDIVNLNKAFKIKNVNGKRDLYVDYEVVIPVFYNISLLFDFKNHVLAPIK